MDQRRAPMGEDTLVGREASHDFDELQVLIDGSTLGINGYQAADWVREHERIDVGLSDHARMLTTLSMADDDRSGERLRTALTALVAGASELPERPAVKLPVPHE